MSGGESNSRTGGCPGRERGTGRDKYALASMTGGGRGGARCTVYKSNSATADAEAPRRVFEHFAEPNLS